ncbi:MAG: histidine kinase [Bacteroidales bacterium]|nr:histidine kinase [Bacteroidales bacterium]
MKKGHKKRSIQGHLFDLLLVVIIGDTITFFFNPDISSFLRFLPWNSFYSLVIGGFLWKGNEALGGFIGKYIDSYKDPFRALRWNLIGMFVYSTLIIIIINYIWWVLLFGKPADYLLRQGLLIMIIEFVVTVLIASILFSVGFFQAWRESAVNEERLKSESLAYQYKALQNQVNPHFLFNSLNTLSSLVYKDQDQAVKFIKQLSEVYRYVLEHKNAEVVELSTELIFVKNYVFLQKIRHGNSLNVSFDLRNSKKVKVIPMSIQMLIENAIKHNIVSEENPLFIEVNLNSEYVIVKNNVQHKTSVQDSGGIGLQNLNSRYELLSDKPILVEESDSDFIVRIPVLKTKST